MDENLIAKKPVYALVTLTNQNEVVWDGHNRSINGNGQACHLMVIHNCHNLTIKNTRFIGGNTDMLRKISRHTIPFSQKHVSIFEIIDGGAVVITGNSTVIFEHCEFIHNKSLMCGGAISNQSIGTVTFKHCTFEKNEAGHTGSAVDNLTPGSHLIVNHCIFRNNRSNTWNSQNGPHGHISVFPKSTAEIANTHFWGGSIPFDFYPDSTIRIHTNQYHGYTYWQETKSSHRSQYIFEKLQAVIRYYWIVPKTIGHVYYRVPKPLI
jgi:hypothetical protein